jgi:hypothetical protein
MRHGHTIWDEVIGDCEHHQHHAQARNRRLGSIVAQPPEAHREDTSALSLSSQRVESRELFLSFVLSSFSKNRSSAISHHQPSRRRLEARNRTLPALLLRTERRSPAAI